MPTVEWLKKEFDYGYDSGDILNSTPDAKRLDEETIIGGSYRDYFLKFVVNYLEPYSKVMELGPGKGSWTRAILEFVPSGEVHTVDFQDVKPWLVNDKNKNRLFCNQVNNSKFDCLNDNYFDLFFSFGVLCHNNSDNILNILKNALSKVKEGGYAIHQYGNWEKLEKFGWEKGRVPTEFKDKPDDKIWWPRNNSKNMEQLAIKAGWEVLESDVGFFERDSVILLRKPMLKSCLKMLNLGCGTKFHQDWTNVDFSSSSPMVTAHNLNTGIPYENDSFDVVYHSHLLEHFSKSKAVDFIKECYRVLKKDGVIRVVVPDLENIVKEYLKNLQNAELGKEYEERYDWIMLELYDQTVRNSSGGDMLKYWLKDNFSIKDYVTARTGSEFLNVLKNRESIIKSLNSVKPEEKLTETDIGKFRKNGEIHQWMYDRFSLSRLLKNAGFNNIRICQANESGIRGFNSYLLDIEADGQIRKPDSLFMEAEK